MIIIDGTSQCVHGSRLRRLKGRCRGIRVVLKGRSCTTDASFYSSTWSDRQLHPSTSSHKLISEPITAPGCASLMNFRDSSLTCKSTFLSLPHFKPDHSTFHSSSDVPRLVFKQVDWTESKKSRRVV